MELVNNWITTQGHIRTLKLCHKQNHSSKLFSYIYMGGDSWSHYPEEKKKKKKKKKKEKKSKTHLPD